MTLNIDVLWDNQNEWHLVCLLSKCFLLRYTYEKPSAYLQCFLTPPSLLWHINAPGNNKSEHYKASRLTSIIPVGSLLPRSHCYSFYSMLICSPSWSHFLFLPPPPPTFPLLLVHQHLGYKIKFVSFWSVNWPVTRYQTQPLEPPHQQWSHQQCFHRGCSFSQCLFFWLRLSICFQVLEGLPSRQWIDCLSQGKRFYLLGEDSKNK